MKRPVAALTSGVVACVVLVGGCASHDDRPRENRQVVRVGPSSVQSQRAATLTRDAARRIADGEHEEALGLLRRALKADPSYGPAHNNLGLVMLGQGRLYESALAFEQAAALLPDRVEPRFNLGMVLERAGRLEEAIDAYNRALAVANENEPRPLGSLVRVRLRRGDRDPSLRRQLEQLILRETRPEWRAWAQRQMAMWRGVETVELDAGEEQE